VLEDQGDLVRARPLYERALAIFEKVRGAEHTDTALSLHSLALLLHSQGDLAGARPLLERALAIFEKVLGPKHPDTARVRNNLSALRQPNRKQRRTNAARAKRRSAHRDSP
jgi:hypothetical protein